MIHSVKGRTLPSPLPAKCGARGAFRSEDPTNPISPMCLGTMMFSGPADEAASTRIVAKAREAGINFIDTADAYNGGNSEQVVGRVISNNPPGSGPAAQTATQLPAARN